MNPSISFLLFLFCFSSSLYAQKFSTEWGKVGMPEVQLTTYDKDPEAEAVVLYDIGESRFVRGDRGFDIVFDRRRRIKVLSRAGLDYAQVEIPWYADGYGKTEKITDIEALTYNFENGQLNKRAVEPDQIFTEQKNERWQVKKFAFPDVREGSIIEYRYRLTTPFIFNLPDWEFQSRIPTIHSQYVLRLVPFYEYVFIAQGLTRFSHQSSQPDQGLKRQVGGIEFHDMVHTYVMKDVPAFRDEAYITSVNDYIMKLDFQLAKVHQLSGAEQEIMTTWPKLNESLLKHEKFGKYLKQAEKLAEKILVGELMTVGALPEDPIKSLINRYKARCNWNGQQGHYATKSAKNFWEQKSGNTAEINLFLVALLRAAGVNARPVISSTRNHGQIQTNYPFEHLFNYVLVLVDTGNGMFLTDATDPLLMYDRIPAKCINGKGLVVDDKEVTWVNLQNSRISKDLRTFELKPQPTSQSIELALSIKATDYDARAYKQAYEDQPAKIRAAMEARGMEVAEVETQHYGQPELPYLIKLTGSLPLEMIGKQLIIKPFLDFPMQKNRLTQKSRNYPVDFVYARMENFTSTIYIPEGYEVLSLPAPYIQADDLVEISLMFQRKEDKIIAGGTYSFKKPVYSPQEYTRIKAHLDAIVQKFNEPLVFQQR